LANDLPDFLGRPLMDYVSLNASDVPGVKGRPQLAYSCGDGLSCHYFSAKILTLDRIMASKGSPWRHKTGHFSLQLCNDERLEAQICYCSRQLPNLGLVRHCNLYLQEID